MKLKIKWWMVMRLRELSGSQNTLLL